MGVKEVTLTYPSFFQRFKGILKFKKEHRNVIILNMGHYIIERGFNGEYSSHYWVTVQYED